LLSNCEVLSLVREMHHKRPQLKHNKQLATIAYETIRFLEDSAANAQTPQHIQTFVAQVKDTFRLTKAEKLQIVNQMPNTLVELQLLIEENEERFSEQAMDQLINIINTTLTTDAHSDKDTDDNGDNTDDTSEDN